VKFTAIVIIVGTGVFPSLSAGGKRYLRTAAFAASVNPAGSGFTTSGFCGIPFSSTIGVNHHLALHAILPRLTCELRGWLHNGRRRRNPVAHPVGFATPRWNGSWPDGWLRRRRPE